MRESTKGGKVHNTAYLQTVTHAAVTVGATTGTALAASNDRTYALFINDSASDIYLNVAGGNAVLHQGVLLKADGGYYEMSESFGNLSLAKVSAISDGAGKALLVTFNNAS